MSNCRSVIAAALLFVAAPLAAQERSVAAGGGYSALAPRDFSAAESGWFATISSPLAGPADLAAELNTYAEGGSGGGFSVTARVTTIAGGPEFHSRRDRRLVGFAQTFLGAAIGRGSVSGPHVSVSRTSSSFIIQVGGGADVALTPAIGVRVGLSALVDPLHADSWRYPGLRIAVGALYRFRVR